MPADSPMPNRESQAPLSVAIVNWRDTAHPLGGGSEVYVEHVAAGLRGLGHDVTIFCAAHPEAPADEIRADGVRFVRRGGPHTVYLRAPLAYWRGRLGSARGGRLPDVVVEVQNGVPFLARLWARRSSVIVLVHHLHREQWPVVFGPVRARLGWWLESVVAPRVNRALPYVAVSQATRSELAALAVPDEHITVIHNGTAAPAERSSGKTAHPSLLVLGRLVPHKRVEFALECVARLREEFPTLRMTVAGRGWWEAPLRRRARELGVEDVVRFAGFVTDDERAELLATSWLSLVPSVKEGWGLVVVEAGAVGTPSVAFAAAGGVAESIIDGSTGALVNDADPAAYAETVRGLLRNRTLLDRLGEEAVTHARQFSWDATVKAFARLIEELPD